MVAMEKDIRDGCLISLEACWKTCTKITFVFIYVRPTFCFTPLRFNDALPIYTTLYFAFSHFLYNALYLAAFFNVKPLFLMGISFCFIYAYFSGTQLGRKTKVRCIVLSAPPCLHSNDFPFTWPIRLNLVLFIIKFCWFVLILILVYVYPDSYGGNTQRRKLTCVCFWRNNTTVSHVLLIVEVSRSHTTTRHSR